MAGNRGKIERRIELRTALAISVALAAVAFGTCTVAANLMKPQAALAEVHYTPLPDTVR
jgi:hypothetical protein